MAKININDLRKRITGILLNSGYTQQEWAQMLDVSQPSVSHYVKGRIPSIEILNKIAEIKQMPIESILFPVTYDHNRELKVVAEKKMEYFEQEICSLYRQLPDKLQKQVMSLLRAIAASCSDDK